MEKMMSLDPSIPAGTLAQLFGGVLANYPEIPKGESTELVAGLYKVAEQLFKAPDTSKLEEIISILTTLIVGTKEQIETLGSAWINMRGKIMLDGLLSKKGGMLEDEDRYKEMAWEFRMVTAGKGIQGISQPIALLQLTTKNVVQKIYY